MNCMRHGLLHGIVLCFAVVAPAAGAESLTVTLHAGDYAINQKGAAQSVTASAFGMRNVPGEPVLPEQVFLIAVPPEAHVTGVSFDGRATSLGSGYRLEPGTVDLPARVATDAELARAQREYLDNHTRVFGSDTLFPKTCARYLGTGGLRKYQVVRVAYTPWQYRGLSGELLFTSQLTVRVDYECSSKLAQTIHLDDTVGESEAQLRICNYAEAKAWYAA